MGGWENGLLPYFRMLALQAFDLFLYNLIDEINNFLHITSVQLISSPRDPHIGKYLFNLLFRNINRKNFSKMDVC